MQDNVRAVADLISPEHQFNLQNVVFFSNMWELSLLCVPETWINDLFSSVWPWYVPWLCTQAFKAVWQGWYENKSPLKQWFKFSVSLTDKKFAAVLAGETLIGAQLMTKQPHFGGRVLKH